MSHLKSPGNTVMWREGEIHHSDMAKEIVIPNYSSVGAVPFSEPILD
jgi:hypothetical protein